MLQFRGTAANEQEFFRVCVLRDILLKLDPLW